MMKVSNCKVEISKGLYLFLFLGTFSYVLIRSIVVNVTYDESCTILDLVPQTFTQIFSFSASVANNHLLNTILIKVLYFTGIQTLFIARLPNVLAFILFSYFSFKLTSEFTKKWIGLLSFTLLLANPFMLDFFSLARGYGLSLAFEMGALYYLLNLTQKENSIKNLSYLLFYVALSVIANFSALNFYLALIGILFLFIIIQQTENQLKYFVIGLFATGSLAAIIWLPIKVLKSIGGFWYGGNSGFYEDTLVSLTQYMFYNHQTNSWMFYSLNTFLVLLFVVYFISLKWNRSLKHPKMIVSTLLLLCILSILLQHQLIGTLYLLDRSALFLYPLFILVLGFALNDFKFHRVAFVLLFIVTIGFVFNFALRANFYKTALWFFDAHTLNILKQINEEGRKKNKIMKVDYSNIFDSAAWYNLCKDNLHYVERVDEQTADLSKPFDYYIFLDTPLERVGYFPETNMLQKFEKDTILKFQAEQVLLFKKHSD